ncbi:MAG TPA: hypothetical protein VJ083_08990 [Sedimentibacter sp.]|nr:hypothetical protein [Sedimentibacter sp.]
MFIVFDKKTHLDIAVYNVKDSKGYPHFLVRHNNQWVYKNAKHYITSEEIISNESND